MADLSLMFGAQASNDENKSLKASGGFGKFGLNQKARVTKIEYKKEGNWEGIDVEVLAGGKTIRGRYFIPNRVWCQDANTSVEPTTPAHMETLMKDMNQFTGTITHVIKAVGVKQETINMALATPQTTVQGWIGVMLSLLPATYTSASVDVFLQWQKAIGKTTNVTFLELPQNMKAGYWIVPAVEGDFAEVRTEDSLTYINGVGVEHPISKDAKFLDGPCANQQKENATSSSAMEANQESNDVNAPWT